MTDDVIKEGKLVSSRLPTETREEIDALPDEVFWDYIRHFNRHRRKVREENRKRDKQK